MHRLASSRGQLLLPMLGFFFLFGMMWIGYVQWCRAIYWKMRIDIAAQATALSAARRQAELLNFIATAQTLENAYLQKASFGSADLGHMQISVRSSFENWNRLLEQTAKSFKAQVEWIAAIVARSNGANHLPVPLKPEMISHRLAAHAVYVVYFAKYLPLNLPKPRRYGTAYFTRSWGTRTLKAQPDHESPWTVCRNMTCSTATSRLWLDADPKDFANNGGFPTGHESIWRGIGIQCFYPQFNARLLSKGYHG
jgi:hypothetical protein